jgi:MFS transporter, ACS family, hexuronate transporter
MNKRYRLVVLLLLFVVSAIAYMDRTAISIAAPVISKEFNLSAAEMGVVFSAFFFAYALCSPLGGYAVDKLGPKRTFGVAMVWWSIFCGATALATGLWPLIIYRVLFGVGESPMTTSANKAISRWFPRHEAGKAIGIALNAGNSIGAAIAGPIVGAMLIAFGWRVAFVGVMMIGFIWLVAWYFLFTDEPAENKLVGPTERNYILENRTVQAEMLEAQPGTILDYLRKPTVIGATIGYFSSIYVSYFFMTWIPTYLIKVHNVNMASMGALTSLLWIAGAIGGISSGAVGDALLKSTGKRIFCRKVIVVTNLFFGAIGLVVALQIQAALGAVAIMALANFCLAMVPGACWMLIQESVPYVRLGRVGGVVNFVANLSGIIGPSLTGYIIEYGGGYTNSFLLAAAVSLTGSLVALTLIRQPRSLPAGTSAQTVAS